MSETPMTARKFMAGDRIRMSAKGLAHGINKHRPDRLGVIAKTSSHDANCVYVRWDGLIHSSVLHQDFLELKGK